ncbi:MAG: lysoplasmalogenase family protein, partial [Candidatus Thorarchaeota archaeon]
TLVFLALVNLVDVRSSDTAEWRQYSLLLFIAMIFCSVGDFLMAGVFYITPIRLLNGVLMFGLGHVFYLLALKNISPLIFETSTRNVITRNLIVWVSCIVAVLILFFFTVFNPSMIELSVGILGYGILLVTVIAFAITKWFNSYTLTFRVALPLGFLLFLFSDWLIGVHTMTDPTFLSGPWVGVTYIIGLILVHLTPLFGSRMS